MDRARRSLLKFLGIGAAAPVAIKAATLIPTAVAAPAVVPAVVAPVAVAPIAAGAVYAGVRHYIDASMSVCDTLSLRDIRTLRGFDE